MKIYSNFRMFIEYITIVLVLYFIGSLAVSVIGDIPYKEVLSSPGQLYACFALYWWPPVFRMADMEKHNLSAKKDLNSNLTIEENIKLIKGLKMVLKDLDNTPEDCIDDRLSCECVLITYSKLFPKQYKIAKEEFQSEEFKKSLN